MNYEDLRTLVKKVQDRHHLTHGQLASLMGYSRGYYEKTIYGHGVVSKRFVQRLYQVLRDLLDEGLCHEVHQWWILYCSNVVIPGWKIRVDQAKEDHVSPGRMPSACFDPHKILEEQSRLRFRWALKHEIYYRGMDRDCDSLFDPFDVANEDWQVLIRANYQSLKEWTGSIGEWRPPWSESRLPPELAQRRQSSSRTNPKPPGDTGGW